MLRFFSRSKNHIWTKGEESGNFLNLKSLKIDCDGTPFLIKASPEGPTCHKGTDTCWEEKNTQDFGFLSDLEQVISNRKHTPNDASYVSSLFEKGINKIAQKVGEEAVETVIEAKDQNDELFLEESADLLFHYLILLQAKGYCLSDIVNVLNQDINFLFVYGNSQLKHMFQKRFYYLVKFQFFWATVFMVGKNNQIPKQCI